MSDETVSTNELTAAEITYARSHDALHVDADGLGFVKRDWLTKFRAAVRERERPRYGAAHGFAGYTLTETGATFGDVMAGQLARELIQVRDQLDAIAPLAAQADVLRTKCQNQRRELHAISKAQREAYRMYEARIGGLEAQLKTTEGMNRRLWSLLDAAGITDPESGKVSFATGKDGADGK